MTPFTNGPKGKHEITIDINEKDNIGSNALFYCVNGGSVKIFQLLLTNGAIAENDYHDRSLLMISCSSGCKEMFDYLLSNPNDTLNFDLFQVDDEGRQCLHYAVQGGNQDIFQSLLRKYEENHLQIPADILIEAIRKTKIPIAKFLINASPDLHLDLNHIDNQGKTALSYATQLNNKEIIIALINKGAALPQDVATDGSEAKAELHISEVLLERNGYLPSGVKLKNKDDLSILLNQRDEDGLNVLHRCIIRKDLQMLQRFIDLYDAEMDTDYNGKTMLMKACEMRDLAIAKILLDKYQVSRNIVDHKGRNALFYAVESGDFELTNLVVESGVTTEPDAKGKTVLAVAVERGYVRITNYLYSRCASANLLLTRDLNGRHAIHYAAIKGDLELIRNLVSSGFAVNDQDELGFTPLTLACIFGHPATVVALLRKSADPNLVDKEGCTPLHRCCDMQVTNLSCAELLISHGASLDIQDDQGETPLVKSVKRGDLLTTSLLLNYGADATLKDHFGLDVFNHCSSENRECISKLLKAHLVMDTSLQAVLWKKLGAIEGAVNIYHLLTIMEKAAILTTAESDEILKCDTVRAKFLKIIEKFLFAGNESFSRLCAMLQEAGSGEISCELKNDAYQKAKEVYF